MGSVIRRENVSATTSFSFADVEHQAREMIAHARAQAAKLIADAEARAQHLIGQRKEEAHRVGLAEGRQAGQTQVREEARDAAMKAAREELTQLTGALADGLAEVDRQKHALVTQAESGLIELAVAIARRVCKTTATMTIEPALANARALLDLVSHHNDIELHMNPAEHELLQDVAADFDKCIGALEHVTLHPDPTVERGGCRVHTQNGSINASIVEQLDRISEVLCDAKEANDAGTATAVPTAETPS